MFSFPLRASVLGALVLFACGDSSGTKGGGDAVTSELSRYPSCNAGRLDTVRSACDSTYDEGSEPVPAAPMGAAEAPVLEGDRVWGIRLQELSDGLYGGEVDLSLPETGEWVLYLGTPNIQMKIEGAEPMCSRYLGGTSAKDLETDVCDLVLGAYVIPLEAGLHRLKLGPIADRTWVRIIAKLRANEPIVASPECGSAVLSDIAAACGDLEEPKPVNAGLFGDTSASPISEGKTYGVSLAELGARREGALSFTPEQSGDYLVYTGTPGMAVTLRDVNHGATSGARACASYLPDVEGDAGCDDALREVSGFRLNANTRYLLELSTSAPDIDWTRVMVRRFDVGSMGSGACAVQIAAHGDHTCARFDDGSVRCWGDNGHGQLGLGDTESRGDQLGEAGSRLEAIDLGNERTATFIAAGQDHSCAVLDDGSVKCWGENDQGQLGLGDRRDRGDDANEMGDRLPGVNLGAGALAVAVAAGGASTCAVLDEGALKCWGNNAYGQLGLGDARQRGDAADEMGDALLPVSTGGPLGSASLGALHTCAVTAAGEVSCWGANYTGQLGLGDHLDRGDDADEIAAASTRVDLTGSAVGISAGGAHSCAMLDSGLVQCWGDNSHGQLGLGASTPAVGDDRDETGAKLGFVNLGSDSSVAQVSVSAEASCAIVSDGQVKCWGDNAHGQLGLGDSRTRGELQADMGDALPTLELGASAAAVELVSGAAHHCARFEDGSVKCWGSNAAGQLGLGHRDDVGDAPEELGSALPYVIAACLEP